MTVRYIHSQIHAGFTHLFCASRTADELTYYIRVTNEIAPFIEQLDHVTHTKILPAITEGHELD